MHTHTARTTLDKLAGELDALMPPSGHDGGRDLVARDGDLIDLKVEYLGGRDVLAIAVHRDHAAAASPIPEAEFVDEPDPMVWAKAFESRFTVGRPPGQLADDEPVGVGDVAGLMVGWFSNFAAVWERRVRQRISSEQEPPRTVTIRRKDNGWDQFAFVDDDGRQVACYSVDPRHVTLVHDRPSPPEWIGHGLPE